MSRTGPGVSDGKEEPQETGGRQAGSIIRFTFFGPFAARERELETQTAGLPTILLPDLSTHSFLKKVCFVH